MDISARRNDVATVLRTADPLSAVPLGELVDILYDELKEMARRQLAREAVGHTLQPTALVHEAYLKLVDSTQIGSRERAYFFAAASRAMRQVLIEHARRRAALKRGARIVPLELESVRVDVDAFAVELLDLDRALDELARLRPRHARVVEHRYFGGMNVDETAAALDVSPRTVKSDWAFARAWLYDRLHGAGLGDGATDGPA